jgi:hypothetical protein
MKKFKMISLLIIFLVTTLNFAEKVAEFTEVFKPMKILVDGDRLIIAQEKIVSIYSLKNMELIADIGKLGEGPGEIKQSADVYSFPDSIVLFSTGKMLWYTKDGKLIKEMKVKNEIRTMAPLKKNYVGAEEINLPNAEAGGRKIVLLDENFKEIKNLYEAPNYVNIGRMGVFKKFVMILPMLEAAAFYDKIFIADTKKGFFIEVFDNNGNHLYTIKKELEPVEISEEFKKTIMAEAEADNRRLWQRVEKVVTFPKYFPELRSFFIEDGKIYATTYKEKDNKHELIILDLKGNILKSVFLTLKSWKIYKHSRRHRDLFTIKNGKIYELVDNPEEELYELHITNFNQ